MKRSAIVLWSLVSAVVLSSSGSAQQTCPFTTGGLVLVTDPTQTGNIMRDGIPDTCTVAGPCIVQGTQPVTYKAHTLVNTNTANPTCVTATLTATCGVPGVFEMYLAAYSPTFNPASICQNYLGSSGVTALNSQVSFSFQVPAGAQFQVVTSMPFGNQCEYTLSVTNCGLGDPQPPAPIPALSPAGLAALFFGLAALGCWRLRRGRAG